MKLNIKKRICKWLAAFLLVAIWSNILYPVATYALTSGPMQQEFQSFEPAGTTEMVNLFSGDFTYNIPLLEVPGPNGGYPLNLHYNAGISMEQEASWVGLGWNLNPGVMTRQVRGIPDEFNGTSITREFHMKDHSTVGASIGVSLEFFGGNLGASLGIGVYNNNYKGVGYTISPSLAVQAKGSSDAGIGFNASIDSQEGVGANASLSASFGYKIGIGIGNEANSGLSVSITPQGASKSKSGAESSHSFIGASYSFSQPSHLPAQENQMAGLSTNMAFKIGPSAVGIFGGVFLSGFHTLHYVDKTIYNNNAYGYLNLHNSNQNNDGNERCTDILDFSREKDGMIRKNSPNLPIPNLTHDVYMANAQGMNAMFRPFRNDVGTVFDPYVKSNYYSFNSGFEVGLGQSIHVGGDVVLGYGFTESGKWSTDEAFTNNGRGNALRFTGVKSGNSMYESAYFKVYGEKTADDNNEMEYVGGDQNPVRLDLQNNKGAAVPLDPDMIKIRNNYHEGTAVSASSTSNEQREPRATAISPINGTNFKNGMQVVQADGSRYIYSIPGMNIKQVEYVGSIKPDKRPTQYQNLDFNNRNELKSAYIGGDGTKYSDGFEQFENKVTLDEDYATAFLLNQVLGADYADADGDGKPSDGDFGYWVKFGYKKVNEEYPLVSGSTTVHEPYKWRAPFNGVNYINGHYGTSDDDKASYMYGEREVWVLQTVETRSHIAVFETGKRLDGKGVNTEVNEDANSTNSASGNTGFVKYLKNIKLYAKTQSATFDYVNNTTVKPLKTVKFKYNYSLCKGVYNNNGTIDDNNYFSATGTGKLTLQKVWFEYENSTRGKYSPYEFYYHSSDLTSDLGSSDENPNYNPDKNDRWGFYDKDANVSISTPNGKVNKLEVPYLPQFDKNISAADFKANLDKQKAAWSLKKIVLPSGALINVQYESDDYGYVQNKPAMQMYSVKGIRGYGDYSISDKEDREVYFDLETPVDKAYADTQVGKDDLWSQYIDESNKVYFKVYNSLKKTDERRYDFVSGYADVADLIFDNPVNGKYTTAHIRFNAIKVGDKSIDYHPFCVAAWQHLRTNLPKFAMNGSDNMDSNGGDKEATARGLVQLAGQIAKVFSGYWKYAWESEWGRDIVPELSYIRLKSPDKVKYGGGIRVKSITINDQWAENGVTSGTNDASTYGQVYDYTITVDGKTISSGVANYEPALGGEENPFRNVKSYPESTPLATENSLFFETPANESYYPGASVGYRQVKVMSKGSYERMNNALTDQAVDRKGVTGATVHEFYTSKEFPILTDETRIDSRPFDLVVPIPLIGQVTINTLSCSQGYVITLNDMHGKPRKVSQYKQDAKGNIIGTPISWVEYKYQSEKVVSADGKTDKDYFKVKNYVRGTSMVFIADDAINSVIKGTEKSVGLDYEFFADSRQSVSQHITGGVSFNSDVLIFGFIVIPAFCPWPNLGVSATQIRTISTNKVIHRSGILVGIDSYEGESLSATKFLAFDLFTGQPILSTHSNNFDDPVYNYSKPAFYAYSGMGPAYRNLGMQFSGASMTKVGTTNYYTLLKTDLDQVKVGLMAPGDEYVIVTDGDPPTLTKYIYEGVNQANPTQLRFYSPTSLPVTSGTLILTRSGNRNQLEEVQENVEALEDPTNRTNTFTACSGNIDAFTFETHFKTCYRNIKSFVDPTIRLMNLMLITDTDGDRINDYYEASGDVILTDGSNTNYTSLVVDIFDSEDFPCGNDNRDGQLNVVSPYCNINGLPFPNNGVKQIASLGAWYIVYDGNIGFKVFNAYIENRGLSIFGDIFRHHGLPNLQGSPNNGALFNFNNASFTTQNIVLLEEAYNNRLIRSFEIIPDPNQCGFHLGVNCTKNGINYQIVVRDLITVFGNDVRLNPFQAIDYYTYPLSPFHFDHSNAQISKVLNYQASTYSDISPADYSQAYFAQNISNGLANISPYLTGAKGTWRNEESYTYVDNRKATQVSSAQTPVLKTDGTFYSDQKPILKNGTYDNAAVTDADKYKTIVFKPTNPFNDLCYPQWRKTSEITRYNSFGQVQESKDVLGRYNSATVGLNGRVTLAASSDAKSNETGYEGFEEFPAGSTVQEETVGASNISTFPNINASKMKTIYKVLDVEIAKNNVLTISSPRDPSLIGQQAQVFGAPISDFDYTEFGLPIVGYSNKSLINGQYTILDVAAYPGSPGDPNKSLINLDVSQFRYSKFWKGKIQVAVTSPPVPPMFVANGTAPQVSTDFAHTGTKSLLCKGSYAMRQDRLQFKRGNNYSYTFSAWVKSSNGTLTDLHDIINVSFQFTGPNGTTSTPQMNPNGPLIEGWQKVEGNFSVPEAVTAIDMVFNFPTDINYYIDDIRIRPTNSLMQTYVYNPDNYRLKASLDDYNFADLYYYDEEGALFLKKKETIKGIKTIQETLTHTKKRANP